MLKLDAYLTTEPSNPIGEAAARACEDATTVDIIEELGEEVVLGEDNEYLLEEVEDEGKLDGLLNKHIHNGVLDVESFKAEGVEALRRLVAIATETCAERHTKAFEERITEREAERYYSKGYDA
jgi:predicted RecB family endonuclease